MVEDEEDEEMMDEEGGKPEYKVFIPGKDKKENENLVVDNSTYEMLHRMNVEWPMLSFDFIPDSLGQQRTKFPMTAFAVGGTQADDAANDKLVLMKMTQLHRTKHDDDSGSDSDSSEGNDDDLDDDPELQHISIKHQGSVNRIRNMPQKGGVVATWSAEGKVHIWDLTKPFELLEKSPTPPVSHKCEPAFTLGKHKDEGFAMDWSKVVAGNLASGDCKNTICRCKYAEGGWEADGGPYKGHTESVEDIQWSPSEAEVFASCSVDKTIRIWDGRKRDSSALSVKASDCDINVITWNHKVPYLLASGDDKGNFRVWDLRNFQNGQPVANFDWHAEAITSIEWCPDQPSVIAASAADNQLTLWDMSLERDAEAEAQMIAEGMAVPEVPPQLIFIHQGQKDIKEIHWHPQCPGVLGSTAADGFNIFKTINS
uniref:Histone-binding protein RBBP4-like N-terminal domain-containing protein n=1 Tax=Guillardia theta TaxID=55529 RepID=A0A7S4P5V3_GUITH